MSADPNPYRLVGPSEDGQVSDLLLALSQAEALQRLQALIAEWLRMENLVVLTGSGCSVSQGGKTMANLEESVLKTVSKLSDKPLPVEAVISAREGSTLLGGSNVPGFEDWLSYLVNAHVVAAHPQSPFQGLVWKAGATPSATELAWAIDRIGKSIFLECALKLARDGDPNVPPHLAFLAKLVARDSNLGRAQLFTLNYDTLFEQALDRLGIQYFDGFGGRVDAKFDPSVYGFDVYYPGEVAEGRVRRFDKFLHLYKLHGSIHWHVEDGELHARHPALSKFETYRDLTVEEKAQQLAALAQELPSVGILPTANKFAQTLSMPFSHLFRAFQIRLSVPQTFLLVLGYGFGDDHVTRVIETALMNPSLIMLVVEPDPNSQTVERIRHYKDLGKRAFVLTPTEDAFSAEKYKFATFDDFSKSIMPDVQWLRDFIKLRAFEKQIQANFKTDPTKA